MVQSKQSVDSSEVVKNLSEGLMTEMIAHENK
jgi:hypothetical protein